ncbi:MAG: BlaI/MecI/CopY family transcriptional regulator [Clostridiales bacterium]|jgi:BlaI family penicillinase repressor|nr:BlaI/MecI/CopY family transcriptional regulator [Clostridiales bacterium]
MKKEIPKLPDAELAVMQAIWRSDIPLSRAEIESALQSEKDWSTNTVLTLLVRLEKKGFINRIKSGRAYLHEAIISEEQYLENASSSLLNSLFRGNPVTFIAALHESENLTEQDIKELEDYLDSLKAGD